MHGLDLPRVLRPTSIITMVTRLNQRPQVPGETIRLTAERRDRLLAFVESSDGMPDFVRNRLLGRLRQEEVPLAMVERIESRMEQQQ